MDRDQFGDARGRDIRPYSLDVRPICKHLCHLDQWVGQVIGPLPEKSTRFESVDHLPLQYTALVEPLCCMLSDDIAAGCHKLTDRIKECWHRRQS